MFRKLQILFKYSSHKIQVLFSFVASVSMNNNRKLKTAGNNSRYLSVIHIFGLSTHKESETDRKQRRKKKLFSETSRIWWQHNAARKKKEM
jgi:hypothetical protein